MKIIYKLTLVAIFFLVFGAFTGLSYLVVSHQQRSHYTTLVPDDGTLTRVLFSSQGQVQKTLVGLIEQEKKGIRFAIYTMTDREVTKALLNAYKRGVRVEGVVDKSFSTMAASTVHQLANAAVPLWVFQPKKRGQYQGIMHNKFLIFDSALDGRALVWTGSYNFTASAHLRNEENVVLLDAPSALESFKDYFEYLKKRSLQISGEPVHSKNPQRSFASAH